ncbi:MAG: glycogen-binding domain-containing protein, partial [Planctomycetes bacterium]|nr:glycogen-binding domain-containing protein [Planctomycetota bacterium]
TITEYDSSSKGMRDFQALANEITAQAIPIPASHTEIQAVEAKLELIGKTADAIILESKELAKAGTTATHDAHATVDEKLDQFYGYRQREGKIEFSALYPKAKKVQLAGDFNSWNPGKTNLSNINNNGRWNVELAIPAGTYTYRYVVDGRWQQDPYNNCSTTNPFGEMNSVLEVV